MYFGIVSWSPKASTATHASCLGTRLCNLCMHACMHALYAPRIAVTLGIDSHHPYERYAALQSMLIRRTPAHGWEMGLHKDAFRMYSLIECKANPFKLYHCVFLLSTRCVWIHGWGAGQRQIFWHRLEDLHPLRPQFRPNRFPQEQRRHERGTAPGECSELGKPCIAHNVWYMFGA